LEDLKKIDGRDVRQAQLPANGRNAAYEAAAKASDVGSATDPDKPVRA